MKQIITICICLFSVIARGQNFQEWTRQNQTQIKYLLQQIAAFNTCSRYVEKGFDITKTGLTAIHNIKSGDLSLHEEYFNSLNKLNSKIKKYWKITDIIRLEIKIIQACHRQKAQINRSDQLSPAEIIYCEKVFQNLLDGCSLVIDQLFALLTDGVFSMKDDQRIKRIDGLYGDIQNRYSFIQSFGAQTNLLAVQRIKETNDLSTERNLYNVH